MRKYHAVIIVITISLLSACGSTPPSNFYRLNAIASDIPSQNSPVLGIGPVTIPEYLNRTEIVLASDSNKLKLQDYDRWAERLDEGITRVVAINLASLVDTHRVARFPWRRHEVPDYGIRVAVVQFDARENYATLNIEWTLTSPKTNEVIQQKLSMYRQEAVLTEAENVAAVFSQLLLDFSNEVAMTINKLENKTPLKGGLKPG